MTERDASLPPERAGVTGTPSLLITGPTASGKGAVALEIARRLDGDIISVDSMKVYRELDVVTAKPGAARRAERVYHLMDLVDPDEEYSVARYHEDVRATMARLRAAGRPFVLVGGTPLYVKVLLEGLVDSPPADRELRQRLGEEARSVGLVELWRRLREVDPEAAQRVELEDERRIIRFLEHHELTGQPISSAWGWKRFADEPSFACFGLEWDRPSLYARVDERVRRMVEAGLFQEAERLLSREPRVGRSARQCIGLKEIEEGRVAGWSREATIERIQRNSRRLAKRQLTWFRKMALDWIAVEEPLDVPAVASEILRRFELRGGAR